jgi:hypothetical protein
MVVGLGTEAIVAELAEVFECRRRRNVADELPFAVVDHFLQLAGTLPNLFGSHSLVAQILFEIGKVLALWLLALFFCGIDQAGLLAIDTFDNLVEHGLRSPLEGSPPPFDWQMESRNSGKIAGETRIHTNKRTAATGPCPRAGELLSFPKPRS